MPTTPLTPKEARTEAAAIVLGTVDPTSPLYGVDLKHPSNLPPHEVQRISETLALATAEKGVEPDAAWEDRTAEDWKKLVLTPDFPALKDDPSGARLVLMSRRAYEAAEVFCPALACAAVETAADCADRMIGPAEHSSYVMANPEAQALVLLEIIEVANRLSLDVPRQVALKKLEILLLQTDVLDNDKVRLLVSDARFGADPTLAQIADRALRVKRRENDPNPNQTPEPQPKPKGLFPTEDLDS